MTALDLIKRSMRLIERLGDGETPTTSEAADCLTAMNAMLDSWSIQRLLIYSILQENFTWPVSTVSRTIGVSGDFNTTRPTRIESAFLRDSGGQDWPLQIIGRQEYDGIWDKDVGATWPYVLFYDRNFPIGTLYLYGSPQENMTIFLNSWRQFTQAATVNSTVSLPPGYEQMLVYNLALYIAPEFGVEPKPEIFRIAKESKGFLKPANRPSMVSQMPEMLGQGRPYDIETGR